MAPIYLLQNGFWLIFQKQITLKASFFTLGAIGLVKDIVRDGLQASVNVAGFINTDLGKVDINFNKQFGGEMNGAPKKKNFYYPH